MSTNAALASGAVITSLNGKRCTAVPKPGASNNNNNNNNGGGSANTAIQTSAANLQATVAATTGSLESTSSSLVQIAQSTTSTTTSTTSDSSSSSSSSLSSLALELSVTIQAQAGLLAPPALADSVAATTSTSSTESPSLQDTSSAANDPTQAAQTSGVQASVTDDSNQATLATVAATSQPLAAFSEASQAATDGGAALFTTIGTDTPAAASTDATTNNPAAISAVESPGSKTESTIAVAGGVVGGLALIGLVAFLVWFWRRRVLRKRRSTLLTPLDSDPARLGRGGRAQGQYVIERTEKGEYVLNRGSIGPTPRAERIKASFDYSLKRVKARFSQLMAPKSGASASSVNMNRGNSQFMEDSLARRPTNGSPAKTPQRTAKDRLGDWWASLSPGAMFAGRKAKESADPFAAAREKKAADLNSRQPQPDFLTLLGMDEQQLDREASKKKGQGQGQGGGSRRKPGSNNGFLGGLQLDFGSEDPFSDANALAHQSAKPAPLVVSQTNNPFSDANAIQDMAPNGIPKPSTYVANIRRSRGQSTDGNGPMPGPAPGRGGGGGGLLMASNLNNMNQRGESVYRESALSVDTFATRRNNKFRSDPFDLEAPLNRTQKTTSSNMSTAGSSAPRLSDVASSRLSGGVGTGDLRRPSRVASGFHGRSDSYSSKYSSGFSLGDWSDPGPDVGPAAARWGDSPTKGNRNSGDSEGCVGTAL